MTAGQKNGWQTVLISGLVAVLTAAIAALPPSLIAYAALKQTVETHQMVNSRLSEVIPLITKGAATEATLKEKEAESARKGAAAIASEEARMGEAAKQPKGK